MHNEKKASTKQIVKKIQNMNGKNWNIFSDNDESSSKKLCKINVKKKSENKWTGGCIL